MFDFGNHYICMSLTWFKKIHICHITYANNNNNIIIIVQYIKIQKYMFYNTTLILIHNISKFSHNSI